VEGTQPPVRAAYLARSAGGAAPSAGRRAGHCVERHARVAPGLPLARLQHPSLGRGHRRTASPRPSHRSSARRRSRHRVTGGWQRRGARPRHSRRAPGLRTAPVRTTALATGTSSGGTAWRASWKGHGHAAQTAYRARRRLAHLQRQALGRGHRVERRAPSRRMKALVLDSVSSPIASPIRPRAVAATGDGKLPPVRRRELYDGPRRGAGRVVASRGRAQRRRATYARGLRSHASSARRSGVVITSSGGAVAADDAHASLHRLFQ
jgi:hypothetical protein